jgi:hypothetical protein
MVRKTSANFDECERWMFVHANLTYNLIMMKTISVIKVKLRCEF